MIYQHETYGDLAIITHQPHAPVKERLEWLTSILIAYDGTEERFEKRANPRQIFEYELPLQYWKKLDSINTVKGAVRKKWAVPVWSESQFVGNVSIGQYVVNCDTTIAHKFENGCFVLITNGLSHEIGKISNIGASSITLSESVTKNINSAYLMPLKMAFVQSDPVHRTNGLESYLRIKFLVQDFSSFFSSTPDQYLDNDIYYLQSVENGFAERSVSKDYDSIDFSLGLVDVYSPSLNSSYNTQLKFIAQGDSEISEFKKFLYRRAGKFKNFWLPTFENDFESASTGAVTTTFLVKRNSIDSYALDRADIVFFLKNGSKVPVNIETILLVDSETIQLNFSTAVNFQAEDVLMISYLMFCRLNNDLVEIDWIGNNTLKCTLQVVESQLHSIPIVIVE